MQKSVTVGGEQIIYRDVGTGTPVILIHGYGGHPSHWSEVQDDLCKDHRVIVPSLGHIYLNRDKRFTFSEMVVLLQGFMDEVVGPEAFFHVVGASYGGTLGWAVTTEFKTRVLSLSLLSPMPPDPVRHLRNRILKAFVVLGGTPFALRAFLMTSMAKRALPRIEDAFIGYQQRRKRSRLELLNSRKVALILHILNRFHWIVTREDWKEWEARFKTVQNPVTIIWGAWDRLFEKEIPVELCKFVMQADLHVVDKAGHLPMKEAPQTVIAILREKLKARESA